MKVKIYISILVLWFPLLLLAQSNYVLKGYVFNDTNANGIKDAGESGISGILVSNQEQIVATDKDGLFEIATVSNPYVYVVKPNNYNLSRKGQFYIDASQTDGVYNFALIPKAVSSVFSTLMVGDPQMRGEKPLRAFRDDIVTEMFNYDVDFACFLGDIADNDLSIYPQELGFVNRLPYPVFHVFGNHDIDEQAESATTAADIFKRSYGPDYYSFNEGDVHFVVLNNVLYNGWNKSTAKRGEYFGGLTDTQYQWLKSDIEHAEKDKLIVVLSHIPFLQQYTYSKEISRLFSLIEDRPNLLALSGHLHYIQNYFFDKSTLWNSSASFQGMTIGAACGGWWTGPIDERGLPVSTCVDGSPNGYYRFTFEGNKYRYEFIPADHRPDFQVRITLSSDTLRNNHLDEVYVSVNVFTATPKATVKVFIDDREPMLAENYTGKDLFIAQTYDLRYNYDNWRPKQEDTDHLWKINLPTDLSAGCHSVRVEATDVNGYVYKGYKLFEIQ